MGRRWDVEFDEAEMRRLLRNVTPRSQLYRVVKQKLKAMGRWKQLPRGRNVGIERVDEIVDTSLSSLRFRRPSSSWNLECLVISRVQIQNLEIEDPGLPAVKNRDMAHQIDPAHHPPRIESDCG
jgi:hypothetical protein